MELTMHGAAATQRGARPSNQDAALVAAGGRLLLLADGTGPEPAGGQAARLTCETLVRELEPLADPGADLVEGRAAIDRAVAAAHRALRELARRAGGRAASTAALALLRGEGALVGHVGDSRVYRMRGGDLSPITRDHTLANHLADRGAHPADPARAARTLVRAVGLDEPPPEVDIAEVPLRPGDTLLLCSDGVSGALPSWVLRAALGEARDGPEGVAACARRLPRAAIACGGTDNATAVVGLVGHGGGGDTLLLDPAELAAPAALAWLVGDRGARRGVVAQVAPGTVMGRHAGCHLVLDDPAVSARHAELVAHGDGIALRDLGSGAGTRVNGLAISTHPLRDGDRVTLGRSSFVFRCWRAGGAVR